MNVAERTNPEPELFQKLIWVSKQQQAIFKIEVFSKAHIVANTEIYFI